MLDYYFNILKQINNQPITSQRQLVALTGTSLGKINKILKECMDKGYIYFDENQPLYILTVVGREYLRNTIREFKQTKLHINNDKKEKIHTAVILAAGRAVEFEKPVGSLPLDEMGIIERQIKILKKYGIQNIFIVTGYKKEVYKELESAYRCVCIENTQYEETGNMYSLSLVKDFIQDDFLLIEGDLVFEEKALESVIKDARRECIAVTGINGFGDEEYVELSEGNITKISKDIRQLGKIHGELMGINKISIELYHLMLNELNNDSNPYLSYEYILFDLAKDYYIPYIKLENVIWGEVDNSVHYEKVLSYSWPAIKKRELSDDKTTTKSITE